MDLLHEITFKSNFYVYTVYIFTYICVHTALTLFFTVGNLGFCSRLYNYWCRQTNNLIKGFQRSYVVGVTRWTLWFLWGQRFHNSPQTEFQANGFETTHFLVFATGHLTWASRTQSRVPRDFFSFKYFSNTVCLAANGELTIRLEFNRLDTICLWIKGFHEGAWWLWFEQSGNS